MRPTNPQTMGTSHLSGTLTSPGLGGTMTLAGTLTPHNPGTFGIEPV